MLKKIGRALLSRTFWFVVVIFLQIALFFWLVYWFASMGAAAYGVLVMLSVVVLLAVQEKDDLNPAYKLMWTLVIILLPVFGAVLYVLWGHRHVPRRMRRHMQRMKRRDGGAMRQDGAVMAALKKEDAHLARNAHYLWAQAASPVYPAEGCEYYPTGEAFFPAFLQALENARHSIFMQYYIWQPGYMLDAILEILRRKAAEGLDVRVMWDGIGSLFTLPREVTAQMEGWGIRCRAFLPVRATLHITDYAMLNHRDHRKITVVDGAVGFSGGLNIADEYINRISRFGVWKDTAFKISGRAVQSLTETFLLSWGYASAGAEDRQVNAPPPAAPAGGCSLQNGYVQPYWDSPLDDENVSENAYLNIINQATAYVYISTPYLVLDHEMITALTLAAKNDVDVRILTPSIPDKRPVFWVTQSYYPVLLAGGVRIFEYTPGFNHAKMYVADDKVAIVGSANMDYRSLYLHFENCAAFYGGPVVQKAKRDMLNSFAASHEITLREAEQISLRRRVFQVVARFFAPLL